MSAADRSTQPADAATERIRDQLSRVAHLRERAREQGLEVAVREIKSWQSNRFAHTYRDFLEDRRYGAATRFFLEELYGKHDFRERDQQFGRIAGAIERLFPAAVAELTIDLAETHALTETLDHEMAQRWMRSDASRSPAARYVECWRHTGERADRLHQLAIVQHMGRELQRLVRIPTLRLALKLMRRPAQAAGLATLQAFLERGFDAFAQMGDAAPLLKAIEERETRCIELLFEAPADAVEAVLMREMAEGPG